MQGKETHPIYGPNDAVGPVDTLPTLPTWAANTDWFDVITDPAPIQNHDFTFSGGNENARFFAGAGIFSQNGIIKHTDTRRFTGRFNSDFKILNNRVTVGENLTLTYRTSHGVANLGRG
jgi:TonB-dependent starch-binding outer membrane protein SusC